MNSPLYLCPADKRDLLAAQACATPPQENLTDAEAQFIRSVHAGHGSNCLQAHARAGQQPGGATDSVEIDAPATGFIDQSALQPVQGAPQAHLSPGNSATKTVALTLSARTVRLGNLAGQSVSALAGTS
ncbi:hypothetical protein ACQP2U_42790 (plasmid) [Nocardia sp. CA-084685]|uniref:hypothetical protein n=1 Tax=Nocardia sp. CA-084685 TaxID=3239970 RepID=UPI003D99C85A